MIDVVAYRPEWPERFEQLRAAYAEALNAGHVAHRIEHVGSTSVPGLSAKPIIDVDVVVAAADVGTASHALETIGFVARGDLGVPDRYAFDTPERFAPSHTYVVVDGSVSLRNHLALRDTLRQNTGLRVEYDAVKRAAAGAADGIDEYVELKSDVVRRILQHAGFSADELDGIGQVNRRITERGALG